MTIRIINADVFEGLREMPDESVHCVVTSPPYWGLRDYGTGRWEGGDAACDHKPIAGRGAGDLDNKHLGGSTRSASPARGGDPNTCAKCGAIRVDKQIGLESSFDVYLYQICRVFAEVRRVLRKDGTLWLNVGDAYAGGGGFSPNAPSNLKGSKQSSNGGSKRGMRKPRGFKPKDLMMMPARIALALQADGWWFRSDIIWHKPNPMPESCTDRPTSAHEHVFLLTKSARYYYDADAVRDQVTGNAHARGNGVNPKSIKIPGGWDLAEGAHGTINRQGRTSAQYRPRQNASFSAAVSGLVESRNMRNVWTIATHPFPEAHYATFPPQLAERCIKAGCPVGGTALDPFGGSGTTAMVADRLGRDAILIELKASDCTMAKRRIARDRLARRRGTMADVADAQLTPTPLEALMAGIANRE